jgi:hypothetical protein
VNRETLIGKLRRDRNIGRDMCWWAARQLRIMAKASAEGMRVDEAAYEAANELERIAETIGRRVR